MTNTATKPKRPLSGLEEKILRDMNRQGFSHVHKNVLKAEGVSTSDVAGHTGLHWIGDTKTDMIKFMPLELFTYELQKLAEGKSNMSQRSLETNTQPTPGERARALVDFGLADDMKDAIGQLIDLEGRDNLVFLDGVPCPGPCADGLIEGTWSDMTAGLRHASGWSFCQSCDCNINEEEWANIRSVFEDNREVARCLDT